jgi:hypothetical protein
MHVTFYSHLPVPHEGAEDTQGPDTVALFRVGEFYSKCSKHLIEHQDPRISFRRGLAHDASSGIAEPSESAPQDRDHAEMYQFLVLLAILARFA